MMNNCIGCTSGVPRPDVQNHPILQRWLRDDDNNDNIDPWADLGGFRTQEHTVHTGSQEGDTHDWGYGSNVMIEEVD